MIKATSVFLASIFVANTALAGSLSHCPNLENGESTTGWQKTGPINHSPFEQILISLHRVVGNGSLTCKYSNNLSLYKVGVFQQAGGPELWQTVNLGGLYYKQCLSTTDACSFYEK